jgi:hypothetical protein
MQAQSTPDLTQKLLFTEKNYLINKKMQAHSTPDLTQKLLFTFGM